jgi:SAM-dependent methyltransferase
MGCCSSRSDEAIHDAVRERYAGIARSGKPVEQDGAPGTGEIAERLGYSAADLAAVPDGANLGVGCGTPLAHVAAQPGETVLDLGSGAGFDALLAARVVGPTGRVIGVDMTPEMLDRARRNAAAAGVSHAEFRAGQIEALPLDDASVDAVISNCVVNLSPDKAAVFREVARVLRAGGRMAISDVVLDAPLPPLVADSVAALTGCVAGAALRADYLRMVAAAGLEDVRVVSERSFGEIALTMVPEEMLRQAQAAGIDVRAVADTVRSVTVVARKPGASTGACQGPR